MKGDNIYSYTLRFDREATPDQQALEKISQFRNMTHMSIQSAMMFMLAAVDISALYDRILSLSVALEEEPEKEVTKKSNNAKTKNMKPEEKQKPKEELDKKNQDEDDIDLDSLIADIFSD